MLIVFTLQRNGASHCLSLFCHTFCKLCMFIYAFITSWSLMDTGCHVVYWCLTECPFYCFSRLAELKSTAKTLVHTGLFIYVDLKVYVFKGKCIMIKCSYNMETFFWYVALVVSNHRGEGFLNFLGAFSQLCSATGKVMKSKMPEGKGVPGVATRPAGNRGLPVTWQPSWRILFTRFVR